MREVSYVYRGRTWFGRATIAAAGLAAGLMAVSLGGCEPPMAANGWPEKETVGELRIGQPVKHGNLTIFPVYSRTAKNDDRFITLDEGLKAGTVEIMETGAVETPPATTGDELPIPDAPSEAVLRATEPDVAGVSAEDIADLPSPPAILDLFADDSAGLAGVDGDVNRLMVVNRSDKPLYLMPGEVIIGGKQDRTVGQEIVIAPTKKPVPIDAFCVEHGRWNERGAAGLAMLASGSAAGQTWVEAAEEPNASAASASVRPILGFFSASPEAAPQALAETAKKADGGQFVAQAGTLNAKVRFEVQAAKDQGAVWDAVAKTNAASGNDITDDTGGFTGNFFDPQVLEKIEPYVAKLNDPIARTERIVGVVVAIDGKFVTMDVFESTPLFAKLWPKLLKSYALDAAIAATEKASGESADGENVNAAEEAAKDARSKPKRTLKIADARAFLADALHSTAEETTTDDGVVMTKREGQYCVSFSAHQEQQVPYVTSVIPVDGLTPSSIDLGRGFGGRGAGAAGSSEAAGVHTSAFGK